MHLNQLFTLPLLAGVLSLTACGGSSSEAPPIEKPVNQAPIVSLVAANAFEKTTVSLSATANDADGTIAAYQWSITSNHDLVLTGANTSSVSFIAPEVSLTGDTVTLKIMVTDNEGAKAEAATQVIIEPITTAFTIKGIATDSPLSNAKISVQIDGRDQTIEQVADDRGNYSVDLILDDSEAESFISITAKGVTTQSNAALISLLGSADYLNQLAGEDKVLTADELFAVNITNITTAKYALAKMSNLGAKITSNASLDDLFSSLEYYHVMNIAVAIKVAIDKVGNNTDLALPQGIEDTLALVEDELQIRNYINKVYGTDEFLEAQEEIYQDNNLLNAPVGYQVPPSYYMSPIYIPDEEVFHFNNNGTGNLADYDFDWKLVNDTIIATVTKNGASSSDYKVCSQPALLFDSEYQLKILSSSEKSDLILITKRIACQYYGSNTMDEYITQSYLAQAFKPSAIIPMSSIESGIAYIGSAVKELSNTEYTRTQSYFLNADGQGTGQFLETPFSWEISQGALLLSMPNGNQTRITKLQQSDLFDIFVTETSTDGINFRGRSVGKGKIISNLPAFDASKIAGIYSSSYISLEYPLERFWFELHANGDAETFTTRDWNDDNKITSDELSTMYGRWKLLDDGKIHITRYKYENGQYSQDCRDSSTQGCLLDNERFWTLIVQKDNQFGLFHKNFFNASAFHNIDNSSFYDNRSIHKVEAPPFQFEN